MKGKQVGKKTSTSEQTKLKNGIEYLYLYKYIINSNIYFIHHTIT